MREGQCKRGHELSTGSARGFGSPVRFPVNISPFPHQHVPRDATDTHHLTATFNPLSSPKSIILSLHHSLSQLSHSLHVSLAHTWALQLSAVFQGHFKVINTSLKLLLLGFWRLKVIPLTRGSIKLTVGVLLLWLILPPIPTKCRPVC